MNIGTDSYEAIIKKHADNVFAVALMMVNDRSLASDISQDVFIRIYKGLHTFKGKSDISTWIYRITKNVCYDYLKKLNKKPEGLDKAAHKITDTGSSPHDIYERDWKNRTIRKAVASLPREQRMAISMHYYYNNSYEEIAAAMDLPMGTVKSHIHRGKTKLKKLLQPLLEINNG